MNKWWVPGLSIGYEHSFIHQVADFLKSLETGEPCAPTFKEALETQRVCEAVINSANSKAGYLSANVVLFRDTQLHYIS
jgi:predicted dehydrogenase